MHETTLTFRSGDHTLVGTLTLPSGGRPAPAALLVPGSGPVDRDSNHKRMPLDIGRQLAHALDARGFATFRYDKRGVGASSGEWRAAGLEDNIADAAQALATLTAAPGVDPSTALVVGHSEGALIAGALAARGTPPTGIVLLSASATPGEELLLWQAAQIAPTLPAPVRAVLRLLRTDLVAKVARNHAKIKATTTDIARIDGARINARWSREFLAYDPRADLARITVPVLAVTGSKDLQVDPADLRTIRATVQGPVETEVVPDVSHILRTQDGPASLSRYRTDVRRPVDPRVLDRVTRWAAAQVARAG
ncbi:S9 family peptidase [uncultured Cellulomonas sp.]|uniref:alpha/beta hydrolase family protein n=1 Tax=uncultured Cellulomonas sp. TaxID=189682 RepID=UPI00260F37E8|nr:alpha/beta fold hydrolase [uncultured Cellulomonas sp.]